MPKDECEFDDEHNADDANGAWTEYLKDIVDDGGTGLEIDERQNTDNYENELYSEDDEINEESDEIGIEQDDDEEDDDPYTEFGDNDEYHPVTDKKSDNSDTADQNVDDDDPYAVKNEAGGLTCKECGAKVNHLRDGSCMECIAKVEDADGTQECSGCGRRVKHLTNHLCMQCQEHGTPFERAVRNSSEKGEAGNKTKKSFAKLKQELLSKPPWGTVAAVALSIGAFVIGYSIKGPVDQTVEDMKQIVKDKITAKQKANNK